MKTKLMATTLAGATVATGAVLPTLSNAQNLNNVKTNSTNNVLLAQSVNNVSGQQAVVVNGNNNLVLFNSAQGQKVNSYLSTGEMLTLMNKDGNFYQVKVQETGAVGYISASNLQVIESGLTSTFTPKVSDGNIINVSTAVHLRAQPDMNAGVLKNLKEGTNVEILGTQGQWVKVNVGGTIGFIYGNYVSNGNSNTSINASSNSSTTSSVSTSSSSSNSTATNKTVATTSTLSNSTKTTSVSASNKTNTVVNNNGTKAPSNSITNEAQPQISSVNIALNDSAYIKASSSAVIYNNLQGTSVNNDYSNNLKTKNLNVTVLNKIGDVYSVKLPNSTVGYVPQSSIVFSGNTTKAEYLNKLNNLAVKSNNVMNSTAAQNSQTSLNMYSYKVAQTWNSQLTDIYNGLMKSLPQAQASQLKKSEASFVSARNKAVDSASKAYQGGSIAPLIENMTYSSQTQQRCFELVNEYGNLYNNSTNGTNKNTTTSSSSSNINKTVNTITNNTVTNSVNKNVNNSTNNVVNNSTNSTIANNTVTNNNVVNNSAANTNVNTATNSASNSNKATIKTRTKSTSDVTNKKSNNSESLNQNSNNNYTEINQAANNYALSSNTVDNLVYNHIFDSVAPCKGYVSYNQISNIINNGTAAQKQALLNKYGDTCLVVKLDSNGTVTPNTFFNGQYYYSYSCTDLYQAVNSPNSQYTYSGVINSDGQTPSTTAYNNGIKNNQVYALGLGQPAYSTATINC